MKALITAIIVVVGIGAVITLVPFEQEITNPELEIQVQEVNVLDKRIEEAQEAQRAEIEQHAQEAYDAYIKKELKRIEEEVKIEYIKELEETIEDPAYWTQDRVERLVALHFPDYPVMVNVCRGESGCRQWHDDGRVVTGIVDPDDTGAMQINKRYWGEEARRLGLDFENNVVDNIKMARHILETQGITAWVYYNNHLAMR